MVKAKDLLRISFVTAGRYEARRPSVLYMKIVAVSLVNQLSLIVLQPHRKIEFIIKTDHETKLKII